MSTYSEKLKDPRWQKKRLEILDRDGFMCSWCCDDASTLHVHHLKYSGDPWDADESDLITLCESCHQENHSERKSSELRLIQALKKMRPKNLSVLVEGFENCVNDINWEPIAAIISHSISTLEVSKIIEREYFQYLADKSTHVQEIY